MNYNYEQAVHDTHPIDSVDFSRWPFYTLMDTTMFVKREFLPMPIFAFEEMGFANLDGVVRDTEAP